MWIVFFFFLFFLFLLLFFFFFFKQKTAYEIYQCDWSSDVCSSDLCRIAEGQGDIYPRLGLTSEWDTAAAQTIVVEAGGLMMDLDGLPLRYNKEDILNPWFIAVGDSNYRWLDLLPSSAS